MSGAVNTSPEYGVGTKKAAVAVVPVDDGRFNYNQRIAVEVSQQDARDYWIRPIGGVVNQAGPFHFAIDVLPDRYLQLNASFLEIQLKVTRSDGTNLQGHTDIVAPLNLIGSTMWESVDVRLNGQPFHGAASAHAGYKGYIDTLLSYDTDARNTHLHAQFLHMDSPGEYHNFAITDHLHRLGVVGAIKKGHVPRPNFDAALTNGIDMDADQLQLDVETIMSDKSLMAAELDTLPQLGAEGITAEQTRRVQDLRRWLLYQTLYETVLATIKENDMKVDVLQAGTGGNVGYLDRLGAAAHSGVFDCFTPINHDFFGVDNMLAPGNRVDIKLSRQPDSFVLNTNQTKMGYRLHIVDMKLHLRAIKRSERINPPLTEIYQMNETQLHRHVVPMGSSSACVKVHSAGRLPSTVVAAMVSTKAADGAYNHNPLFLHHWYVGKMNLNINGVTYPVDGIRTNFDTATPLQSRAYHWLFANTGAAESDKGNLISWNGFHSGQFVTVFDLSPDLCNNGHNHNATSGFIDMQVEFDKPLPEPIYILYECVYSKVLINEKSSGTVMTVDVGI